MQSRQRVLNIVHNVNVLNHLDSATTNEESSQDYMVDFNTILNVYIALASDFTSSVVIESTYEFRNNYSSLLISMQTFINDCLTNTDKQIPLTLLGITGTILHLIWNLSDKIAVIPILIDTGYIEKSIEWIHTDIFASHINALGTRIFAIVYNLSRDKTGLKQLRRKKAFDVLMKRKQLVNNENDPGLTQNFGTTLIALAAGDELSEEDKKLILDTSESLYELCKEAAPTTELKTVSAGGLIHLSELLELLHRAFANTYVIKHILDNKTNEEKTPIQYFAQLLLQIYGPLLDPEPDELEKHAAKYLLKILSQISSYPEYVKELADNNQFCIIIQSLANRLKQDDANRIWCNIKQTMSPDKPKKEKEMSSMIYISYDRTDQDFCKEFVNQLSKKITIPIWVDYEKVELCDDMWEYISPIIKSAKIVIALVSTAYAESTDKFQELSYIISTNNSRDEKKGLIVVKAEPEFKFNRDWMTDFLDNKIVIPYEDDIRNTASRVSKQIKVSKKPLFNCLLCHSKNVRKKTAESDGSSANSGNKFLQSIPIVDSSLTPTKTYVKKKSSNKDDGSNVVIPMKNPGPCPVVACLFSQIGSAYCSIWV